MTDKRTILVTGANGQLGMEFRDLETAYPEFRFIFTGQEQLSIGDEAAVELFFRQYTINVCINCAAYTAVDKAETEKESAFHINGTAVGLLASACSRNNALFIHYSTDYVFNGNASTPYKETDPTEPVNLYGASKLAGEQAAMSNHPGAIIIRTSWVYSTHGKNFVKTMMRLMSERDTISVVGDQLGSPTYAHDLAKATMEIILSSEQAGGIYHYSNEGIISWYDFAVAIREISGCDCTINAITSDQYPTPAKRPNYSAMDTTKIKEVFGISIPNWRESLVKCINGMRL